MKKKVVVVLMVLAASLAPISGAKTKIPSYPAIEIRVPESVVAGTEVTVEIVVTYKNPDDNNHIMFVWLYKNYRLAQTWVRSENDEFNEDQFTLTYTTVLTEDTTFFAYAKSTIRGSTGVLAYVEVVPSS